MPETLFIVDMYSLVFQVFHAIPEMTGPSGQPTNAVFGFTRDLQTIRALPGATHLICASTYPDRRPATRSLPSTKPTAPKCPST